MMNQLLVEYWQQKVINGEDGVGLAFQSCQASIDIKM
jgi:hypothetical protein